MLNVKIDEDSALDALVDRVKVWKDNPEIIKLFESMYESYIYGGVFDGGEFDVMSIVDNDVINYCSVIEGGDSSFEKIKKVYDEQGLGDCSCEDCEGNFIEAVNDDETMFLIRW